MPYDGSQISGDPLPVSFDESTRVGARRHESPFPEPEGRGAGLLEDFSAGFTQRLLVMRRGGDYPSNLLMSFLKFLRPSNCRKAPAIRITAEVLSIFCSERSTVAVSVYDEYSAMTPTLDAK